MPKASQKHSKPLPKCPRVRATWETASTDSECPCLGDLVSELFERVQTKFRLDGVTAEELPRLAIYQ